MIISKTPLRISFAGGGTDIASYYKGAHSGAVVNTAIDKYIYITVSPCFSQHLILKYSKTEDVYNCRELKHTLACVCLEKVGITHGVEINVISDIPSGTGLGSSSSFTVGLLNALYAYKGIEISAGQLAAQACEIEIEKLGSPIGKQDQFAAAYGGIALYEFNSNETVERYPIKFNNDNLKQFHNNLMLFYTGRTHRANDILEHQQKNAKYNEYYLNLMKEDAYSLNTLLKKDKLDHVAIGNLIEHGWYLKRGLANEITTDEINLYYDNIRSAGALGGKLLGAGGGGFLLFYCLPENQEIVKQKTSLQYVPFNFESKGSSIIYHG